MHIPILCLFSMLLFFNACSEKPQPPDSDVDIPLITAAEKGDLTQLKHLIKSSHIIDIRDNCQWTPLMKAALNGHLEATRSLIQAGASVNLADKGGYTAMMLAASNNHAEIVKLLLTQGANVNQVENTRGWTALIWAAKQGHLKTVRILLDHKANPNQKDFLGKTAKDWAFMGKYQAILDLLEKSTG